MTLVGHGPRHGFRVPGRKVVDIRATALSARRFFEITGSQFNAEAILESLSRYGVTLDVVADDDQELPRGIEACWVPDTVTLTIRESVYVAACQGVPRALFTVAHELGHLILAHRRPAFNRQTQRHSFEVWEDSEWQADQFAAELLMPLPQMIATGLQSADQIAGVFGVSVPAAGRRLKQLRKRGDI